MNLATKPPFVLALEDVERVHFERVDYSLKNFDLVFILKDYNKKVTMITSIPMKQIESIREWLDSGQHRILD